MTDTTKTTTPLLYPAMRYKDSKAMIAWLEKAFGFTKHAAYENDQGGIMHAEMSLGSGIVMFGDANPGEFGKHVKTPGELGGTTQSVYVAVPDADAVFARAKAAGAEIIMGLTDQPYGSRDFICKDPEGHVWSFGTYAPKV